LSANDGDAAKINRLPFFSTFLLTPIQCFDMLSRKEMKQPRAAAYSSAALRLLLLVK